MAARRHKTSPALVCGSQTGLVLGEGATAPPSPGSRRQAHIVCRWLDSQGTQADAAGFQAIQQRLDRIENPLLALLKRKEERGEQ